MPDLSPEDQYRIWLASLRPDTDIKVFYDRLKHIAISSYELYRKLGNNAKGHRHAIKLLKLFNKADQYVTLGGRLMVRQEVLNLLFRFRDEGKVNIFKNGDEIVVVEVKRVE